MERCTLVKPCVVTLCTAACPTACSPRLLCAAGPSTIWHSKYEPTPDALPHAITLDFGGDTYDLTGLEYLPRQTGVRNGNCGRYAIYVSDDGDEFDEEAVATGTWEDSREAKTVRFVADGVAALRLECMTEVRNILDVRWHAQGLACTVCHMQRRRLKAMHEKMVAR